MEDAKNFESVYGFLRENYLHSRFEGSGHCKDFPDYPERVTQSTIEQLSETGVGYISKFESRTGTTIIFDKHLNVINKDAPPEETQCKASHLTHIYGA